MTISSQTRKAGPFIGNGSTTAFPFSFKVFATSDLVVTRANTSAVETVLTVGTDYTVSLNANQNTNPGGTVTLTSALASNFKLVLTSAVPNLQPVDITNNGGFYPKVINDALDRVTILAQQIALDNSRAVKVPITSSLTNEEFTEQLFDARDEAEAAASAAASSQTAASGSATSAAGSASTATTQASAASTSATSAASSATAAAGSATAAAGSATTASNSATTATNKANEAASSATGAAGSASTATTQAGIATTKAGEASTSAAAAAGSQTAAASSASSAGTSATNSANSATSASNSAASASASATTAQNWATKTDGPVSGSEYSAKYWANEAATAVAAGVIDDSVVSTVKTWSSDKLVDALKNGAQVTDFGAVGDGTTEDTTAVQAAINSGAKLIVFPAGKTFLIDQVTSAGTDTTFYAVGSTIKLKANSTIYRPLRINHARCTVIGGTWDGNKANQTAGDAFGSWAIGIHADDGVVCEATIKNFRGSGVKVVGGNRCTVERCRITDIGYSTSATCYGIYMETTGGVALYGNKARDNYIALGNEGILDQGILFTSNSTTGGEAQWDWEISGNTVMGSTNATQGDGSICLAARGHRGKVIGNTTVGGAMGWSEGGDQTVIQGNTFKDTVGTLRWGIEASGSQMVITGNVATGHLRAICFSFPDNDDMLIAGNTLESDGTGNHCIAAEIPVGGTGKNLTVIGNVMRGRRGIIATRQVQGMNVSGNTFVGPGSGTSGSRFIFIDSPVSTAMYASIKANKISACERAVSVYAGSAMTVTDIAFTGNNVRDDVAGGVYAHVIAEGSATLGSRIKNFDNEQNSSSDNFNMLFDNTNRRGIEVSNSYATPEGNVTAGVGSIYVNLAGAAGTVLWVKESGTGNTGWGSPVTVQGGKTLALGGATAQTGTGITFPATQNASSNGNTMDDYEEGTWTPTWFFGSTQATADGTGRYVKIGTLVTVTAQLGLSAKNGGTGSAEIRNFPFAPNTGNEGVRGGAAIGYFTGFSSISPYLMLGQGSTTAAIRKGAGTDFNNTEVGDGSSIWFSYSYVANN